MKNEAQMDRDPDAPAYREGMLLTFFHELEGAELERFLDECKEALAIQLAYKVAGKGKDLEELLTKEMAIIKLIAQEEITNPVPPPN
jgi:hypothetical protein